MNPQVAGMKILEKHAFKQLAALGYEDEAKVCLRAFLPDRGTDGGRKSEFVLPYLPVSEISAWQDEGRGIYFVVNPGGHKDSEISVGRAIFFEHDNLSKEVSAELWKHLGLPEPTCQVDTGGKSIHSYWALEESIAVEEWRSLQTDLLEYADADRSLKNPSRVMRLAGCKHGKTGQFARIVGGCGESYPVSQLRALIPGSTQPELPQAKPAEARTWTQFCREFSFPVSEVIPLDICLSKASRDLCTSGAASNRNDQGAKLARDLLGTAAQLQSVGQRFEGDPYSLFLDYCQRCTQGDGWNQREWDSIWKSAQSDNPGASLSPEHIENCVKSWLWKFSQPKQSQASTANAPEFSGEEDSDKPTAADLRTLVERYVSSSDEFERELLAVQIRSDFKIGDRALQRLTEALMPKRRIELIHVADISVDGFTEVEKKASGELPSGLACGFYDLDVMTQGFQRSDLIIVAGRPSMGKSSCCLGIAKSIAQLHRLPVLIYGLEMSRIQMVHRLWSWEAGIDLSRIRAGKLDAHEWDCLMQASESVAGWPIFIDDTASATVADIESSAKEYAEQNGELGMIVIDYLQLISTPGDNRVYEISKMTRQLKVLARELNVPIIALSQLSRGVESRTNKRPMMSDLRESGGIENDADLIMMLYREEYYDPETPDRGIAEIIISKHRNGPTGTVKLLFEPAFTRFRNLAAAG